MGASESHPPPPAEARPEGPPNSAPAEAPAEPRPALLDEHAEQPAATRLLPRGAVESLAGRLRPDERARWRLLFDSAQHGQSFNRFLKHVLGKGPTLLVVRTTAGDVLGGYAPESWAVGPKFHGGYSCFLFRLTAGPDAGPGSEAGAAGVEVHPASGDNRNFMYVNEQMEALPNGVAFGGQRGHFGLWLHAGLDTGESSGPCSTFEGELFAAHATFDVEAVEVWATRDEPPPDALDGEDSEGGTGGGPGSEAQTVLQRRRQEKDFMAMARGSTFASDNI